MGGEYYLQGFAPKPRNIKHLSLLRKFIETDLSVLMDFKVSCRPHDSFISEHCTVHIINWKLSDGGLEVKYTSNKMYRSFWVGRGAEDQTQRSVHAL